MDVPNTYLFTAYYDEGNGQITEYRQDEEDTSLILEGKNAYHDIQYAEKPFRPIDKLYAFRLSAIEGVFVPEGCPTDIAVNLRTRQFEANGAVFSLDNNLNDSYDRVDDVRLIYYRDVRQIKKISRTKLDNGQFEERAIFGYQVGYVLGWKGMAVKRDQADRSIQKFISIGGVPVYFE